MRGCWPAWGGVLPVSWIIGGQGVELENGGTRRWGTTPGKRGAYGGGSWVRVQRPVHSLPLAFLPDPHGDKPLRGEDGACTEAPLTYRPPPHIPKSQNTGAQAGAFVLHSDGGSFCGRQGPGLSVEVGRGLC